MMDLKKQGFADRFTLLHQELVQEAAAGGINSNPILPLKEFEGNKLVYLVGIWMQKK